MQLKLARQERDCSPPLPRELSPRWPRRVRARRLRRQGWRAGLGLLRLLLRRAELLVAGPVAVLVRARESWMQHLRARLVRYFRRRPCLCSQRDWIFWKLLVRLASAEQSLLLVEFGLSRSLHW